VKISIVTISYNQNRYLRDALESVLSQDHNDLEFIVVDAGSNDGSRETIATYADKISKVILEPDQGPSDGLNKGFSVATGEVFGFLNSDDLLLSGALREVSAFFERNPEIDVVSGHSVVIDQNGTVLRKAYSDRYRPLLCAYDSNILMQQSTFFRASAYKRAGGFNLENKIAWDGELFVDMSLAGARFATVNKFWGGFRLHPLSITSSAKLDCLRAAYRAHVFTKIMGRERRFIDTILGVAFRIVKHLRNPVALFERIANGPIYRRKL
jgi:glycosyltransferase involved in cell wall biosynthesis